MVVDNGIPIRSITLRNSFPFIALATLGLFYIAFQIYCDFSGYSDMAIGAARIMGFDLMKNFNTPYFSSSVFLNSGSAGTFLYQRGLKIMLYISLGR